MHNFLSRIQRLPRIYEIWHVVKVQLSCAMLTNSVLDVTLQPR